MAGLYYVRFIEGDMVILASLRQSVLSAKIKTPNFDAEIIP